MENTPKTLNKEVLSTSFNIYKKNFLLFTLIAFVSLIPDVLENFCSFAQNDLIDMLLNTLFFLPIEFAIVKITFSNLKGEELTIQECFKGALPKLFGLFMLDIIVAIISSFLTLFFIIPGIMFYCASFFAGVIYILENNKYILSIEDSFKLTKNYRIDIFKFILIFILPNLLCWNDTLIFCKIINSLLTLFMSPFFAVITIVLYTKLKTLKKSF